MPAVIKVRDAAPCLRYLRSQAVWLAYEVALLSLVTFLGDGRHLQYGRIVIQMPE